MPTVSPAEAPALATGDLLKALVRRLYDHPERPATLLAVCPNSEAVARAALRAARRAEAPILFAATLNQVDVDGGYTGWTPAALVGFLAAEAARLGLTTPVLPCLDHGGPWLKDRHTTDGYTLDETMAALRRSLEACLDAGYALLHIDPTVDRTLPPDRPLPVDLVVERTLDLMVHAEDWRRRRGLPPVAYEVGTEEVHGGLADLDVFDAFLRRLDVGLAAAGRSGAWPTFVVGKVGTDLHTTWFDPATARRLTARVRPYGALIKGHYTDYVDNPEDYPLSGMGAANVGPEFTEEEFKALEVLVALERKTGADAGLDRALTAAVVESGRWKKWLQPTEQGAAFEALPEDRRRWLVRTGSRYIWTDARVREARQALYHHLRDFTDADAFVLFRIETAILRYFHAFNLIGFAGREV